MCVCAQFARATCCCFFETAQAWFECIGVCVCANLLSAAYVSSWPGLCVCLGIAKTLYDIKRLCLRWPTGLEGAAHMCIGLSRTLLHLFICIHPYLAKVEFRIFVYSIFI
jgi:hypothetical protein